MTTLKPCPFCGFSDALATSESGCLCVADTSVVEGVKVSNAWAVVCPNCLAQGPKAVEANAAKGWNGSDIQPEIEESYKKGYAAGIKHMMDYMQFNLKGGEK